ncbi:hypothetical protein [Pseudomonas sichuanensis]|uniref:hypothetical protein n=1 Tax=Pseudomonas sichuanensis TaxID=2213015 RepID=UPI002B400B83|nr:hypothetical protein [Pseudomonas sichuanensis]
MSIGPKNNLWEDSRLRAYLGAINRRCGVVETLALPTMRDLPPVKIETLFVPPLLSMESVDAGLDAHEWPQGKNFFEEIESTPRLVVLGDPGGGKTTLSNWVAWRLTSGLTSPLPERLRNVIPLTCVLREMPVESFKEDMNISGLASYTARKLLDPERAENVIPALNEWISSGKYILILDGVDEIPVHNRPAVARWIREARDKDACVLATSRVVGYQDYPVDSPVKEMGGRKEVPEKYVKRSVSLSAEVGITLEIEKTSVAWAETRYLMPFDKGQISDFVRNWYRQRCTSDADAKDKTSDLLGALNDSEVTSKLARTPNLLSLMAVVHRERAHLPDGKALLYEEIVNAYLNTIDVQRKIIQDDELSNHTWKDKKNWLSYVGYMMQESRQGYSREGILVSEKKVLSWLTTAMRKSKVFNPEGMAVEFLAWVARRSGLLLPRGEGFYAFVHLSFQEYFCACYIEMAVVTPDFFNSHGRTKVPVRPDQIAEWASKTSWLETLIFVFEILSNERNSSWVNSLVGVIYSVYPKYVPADGALGLLASRIVTNKHVKLEDNWIKYLADISCVMVHGVAGDPLANGTIDSFVALGLALIINDDKEVAKGVRSELVKSGKVDVSRVRILIVRSVGVVGSSLLEKFDKLFVFDCYGCGVVDVSSLPSKCLRYISVFDTELKGCEVFGSFKKLEMLTLVRVCQEGIELNAGSANIDALTIYDVNISSVSFIAGWKKLVSLDINKVQVADFSALGSLSKLSYLTLEECPIDNVNFLTSLKALEHITFKGCPITCIPTIKSAKPFSVNFDGLQISDLAFLGRSTNFRGGMIASCPVKSLEGFGSPGMSFVGLSKLPLESFCGVENLLAVRSILLRDINLEDMAPFAKMKKLTSMRIFNVPFRDFKWAQGLNNLYELVFAGAKVQDVTPLLKMKNLREVTVAESEMADMTPLLDQSRILVSSHPDNYLF